MKRNYNVAQYTEVIKKLKKQFPCCGLGTDVIVGFPAETESNFKNTQQLIESLPFSYLHVFSYSKRPGTKAFNFPDQISPKIIKHRSEVLRQIAFKKKQDYYRSQIGQLLRVLWEEKKTNGWLYGLSDQYARVKAKVEGDLSNTISQVKIANASFDGLVGQIVS
jgi:threonylcarbamoyladenosine tRNA methylthiotransferase MtaB